MPRNEASTIDELFRYRKCNYESLRNALIAKNFNFSLPTNIFLNLNKLTRMVQKEDTIERRSFELMSGILGFVAYFKHFFVKQRILPAIFLYGDSNNNQDTFEYLQDEEYIDYLYNELEALKTITRYLPDIYFVETGNDIPVRFAPQAILTSIKFGKEENILFGFGDRRDMLVLCSSVRPCYELNLNGGYTRVLKAEDYQDIMANYKRPEEFLAIRGDKHANINSVGGIGEIKAKKFKYEGSIEDAIEKQYGAASLNKYRKNYEFFSFEGYRKYITPSYKVFIRDQLINLHDTKTLVHFSHEHCSLYPLPLGYLTIGD